jgi:hypothetical protein
MFDQRISGFQMVSAAAAAAIETLVLDAAAAAVDVFAAGAVEAMFA